MDEPRSLFALADAPPATAPDATAPDATATEQPLPTPPASYPPARLRVFAFDLGRAAPAGGLQVVFERIDGSGHPISLGQAHTDAHGRATAPDDHVLDVSYYRVTFNVAPYLAGYALTSVFPAVSVLVRVADDRHDLLIPLHFSAGGYSTFSA